VTSPLSWETLGANSLPPLSWGNAKKVLLEPKETIKKKFQRIRQDFDRFGKTLGLTVETSKIVTNAAVGTLDEMSLRLGHRVRLRNAESGESDIIATVGVCVDMLDIRTKPLYFVVDCFGCPYSLAYHKRDDSFCVPRICRPYYRSVSFFLTNVYISSSSMMSGVSE